MEEQVQEIVSQKNKQKQFYQKWWFWVIIVLCTILIISAISEDDSSQNNEESSTQKTEETPSKDSSSPSKSTMSEEDYKNACRAYTYNELARTPDSYKGKKIVLTGEVVQVIESANGRNIELRVYMHGTDDDIIYVTYTLKSDEGRILEDDILEIYGTFRGLVTYESVLGAPITIPCVDAEYIEQLY